MRGIQNARLWAILRAGLLVLGVVLLSAPSWVRAEDDAISGAKLEEDDPAINARGALVNRVLLVLRHNPDSASDACLTKLDDMHKAQKQLEGIDKEEDDNNSSLSLVRDVLASDMEESVIKCGADAAKLCKNPTPELARPCAALPELEAEDEAP